MISVFRCSLDRKELMPVITFANTKGGSGKTTSALLLACELAESKPTTLIDADPRKPITAWAEMTGVPDNLTVVSNESEKTIVDEIDDAAARDPFVIVDVEGTASRLMTYAMSISDLVIIPLKEQQQDALAAIDVLGEMQRTMRVANRTIPHVLLFTQTKAAVKSRTARHIQTQFRNNPKVNVFDCEIVERDAFSAIFAIGGTIRNLDPKKVSNTKKAVENVTAFMDETITLLRSQPEKKRGGSHG